MASLGKQEKTFGGKPASRLVQDLLRDKNSKPGAKTKKEDDDIIEELVRAAAAGVGFVSEAIKYRKQKKALQQEKAVLDDDAQEQRTISGTVHELPSSEARPGQDMRDSGVKDLTSHVHETGGDLDDAGEERETATDVAASQTKKPTETKKKKKKKKKKKNALQLADEFIERYPFSPPEDRDAPRSKLALPVILAQRRPKTRSRGFVRAYAPMLAEAGIEQECFLDCIDALNLSMVPNEWLRVINLAGLADVVLMEPLLMLAGMALELATEAAIEAQSRHRSNKFLDRVNAEFFVPRGLVAFVATWKPDSTEQVVSMGLEDKMAPPDKEPPKNTSFIDKLKELDRMTSSKEVERRIVKQLKHKIRPHSGPIGGLEPAPLVFPAMESSATNSNEAELDENGQTKKKNKAIYRAAVWVDEHMDRHSQAKWRGENPELPMAQMLPAPQFRSRYADPNHAAASGNFVDLVTGGKWALGKKKAMTEEEEELELLRQQSDSSDDSSDDEETRVRKREKKWRRKREEKERKKMEKKERDSAGWMSLIKMDVMYLVVCNLPTEEEMHMVRQYMHGSVSGSEKRQEEAQL